MSSSAQGKDCHSDQAGRFAVPRSSSLDNGSGWVSVWVVSGAVRICDSFAHCAPQVGASLSHVRVTSFLAECCQHVTKSGRRHRMSRAADLWDELGDNEAGQYRTTHANHERNDAKEPVRCIVQLKLVEKTRAAARVSVLF